MDESGRAPIELILWGCGREEWGDGRGRLLKLWSGGASGLPVVGDGETGPRRRSPTGTPPRPYGYDVEGMVDMPAGRCFGNLFLGIAKGLRTTRRMPGASCPSSNIWRWYGRSGVTPERAPIPAVNGRAFERPARFGQGMGWLAQKRYSRVGPGLLTIMRLVLRSIQGWRLRALRHAVRPRRSDWDMAVIRNREILARCPNGGNRRDELGWLRPDPTTDNLE